MNAFAFIKSIFAPAVELIDVLHTSEEEKLTIKANTLQTYASALETAVQYEAEQLKAKAKIVTAEAESEHWVTATWRPITMLTFLVLIVGDAVGILANPISPELWVVLKIGIGGYIGSRGVEKVIPPIMAALKSKDQT